MLKKISSVVLLLALCAAPTWTDPQISRVVTFTSGTAQRVAPTRTMANSLLVEMLPGSTGIGYVLYADPALTCVHTTAGQIVAELAPGTATAPGGNFTFPSNNDATTQSGGSDMNWWCVEGTTSDTAIVSYDLKH